MWLTENNNLLIHSFIHSFILNRIKKISVQFRCIYITTIHRNDRCISRESIRVVLFSIEVVAKNMETIVLRFLAETCQFNGVNNLQTL